MSTPHLTPRQKAREIAFQFIYQFDQNHEALLTPAQIEVEFKKHLEHFGDHELSSEFALRLVQTTIRELKIIDERIENTAQNWKFERLASVDKAFLRIGVAELLFFKDVPASVTLNEVIELSKTFGEADTPAFLNGVLDPISRDPEATRGKVPSTT